MNPLRVGVWPPSPPSRARGPARWPLLLLLLTPLLLAQASWTEDKGEAGSEADALALGVDVERQVGPPAGAPKSGAALESGTVALASRLRCPSCQSHSINDSPAESARNMKRQVRAMVAAGYDEAQVLAYFESAYGEFVLMMPKARGFNDVVWLAPPALLLVGLFLVWRTISRKRGGDAQAGAGWGETPPPADEGDLAPYLDRVRKELARDG